MNITSETDNDSCPVISQMRPRPYIRTTSHSSVFRRGWVRLVRSRYGIFLSEVGIGRLCNRKLVGEVEMKEKGKAPLLEAAASPSDGTTVLQTLGNIVVSVVGTGVLGLPYAFRVAGWLAGSLGVAAAGLCTFYCMILLVHCRRKLEEEKEETNDLPQLHSYGDLGAKAFGSIGRYMTEFIVFIANAGGAIAYLVFIGQNLSSIVASFNTGDQHMRPAVFIFLLVLPIQIILSFIRSLSTLAPFSAFADFCTVLAMALVFKEDLQAFDSSFKERSAFNGTWGLPFAGGVAVFCFEGFSMTLALEASMAERRKFPLVLFQALFGIIVAYVCFGIFGYLAYGDEIKDIITLNLPDNWTAVAVKAGLCIALTFTFPIMMHPINEITETRLKSSRWFQKLSHNVRGAEFVGLQASRILVLAVISTLASFIPGFGYFVSFVGSTVCALLSFVLPAIFHLTFLDSEMRLWQRVLDYCILVIGIAFAGFGTYNAITDKASVDISA
ncbi:amino acid transporter ANT1 [Canna indica]|uniref:Amino acid transporter ANT1 n=1 Tax=Canna indica TaxID=4628 RepID=A0AAQ3KTR5_9LILI|nr:amino acid transporter ANT1 [Canna indica]